MNIQFQRDREITAFDEYEIYLNGRHVGRIYNYGDRYSVSLRLPPKTWSAHIYPTLEEAQNFVREMIQNNS